MHGVLLAGGTGSRLWPLTKHANKHTLPVYDRPMIFHPLKNLLKAGIQNIVVVTGDKHNEQMKDILDTIETEERTRQLLNITSQDKPNLRYGFQDRPDGIADALALAERIVRRESVAVMLADNVFEDDNVLVDAVRNFRDGAHVFLKEIPSDKLYEKGKDGVVRAKYGIARIDNERITEIIEKPTPDKLPSHFAVTGAYLYDSDVFAIPCTLKYSPRGELEITDVNNTYIERGKMKYSIVEGWWGDAGESIEGLFSVSELVRQKLQKLNIIDVKAQE